MYSAVEDVLIPDNGCRLSLGFRFDKVGRAVQRNGYVKIGDTISGGHTSDGLTYSFIFSTTQDTLVAAYNGTNYANIGGNTWHGIGGGMSAGTRVRYANFLDHVYRVGGAISSATWDGNTADNFVPSAYAATTLASSTTTLNANAAIGDSTLTVVSTATFPDVGHGLLESDVISWTAKDATHLLGVTGVITAHLSGAAVSGTGVDPGATILHLASVSAFASSGMGSLDGELFSWATKDGTNNLLSGVTNAAGTAGILNSYEFGDPVVVADMPKGTLIQVYKSRVYVAGIPGTPDRLIFSSVPDSSGTAITWNPLGDYFDVNPSDGDSITGLDVAGGLLLIFKRDNLYRWNGTSTDADSIITVGAVSQEVIANVKGTCYFFHPSGVYSTDGGIPVEMSRPVLDFIQAIDPANYGNMCAYSDDQRYGLFCGDVTVNGRVFHNLVLEYDVTTQVWQPHVLSDAFRNFTKARVTAGLDYVAGGASGQVNKMFTGNTDAGKPVVFERETKRFDWSGLFTTKVLNDFSFYLSGCPTAIFEAIPLTGSYLPLDPVIIGGTKSALAVELGKKVEGNAISFRISGSNTKAPAEWRGFEILKGRDLGYQKPNNLK